MMDEEQFDEWYPEAKVYYDGGHYIAIPHTTNPTRRRKHKHEIITVSEQDGKLKLEKTPPVLVPNDDYEIKPSEPLQVTLEEVVKEAAESGIKPVQEPEKAAAVKRRTTRKQIFEELYAKYIGYSRKARIKAIYDDMLPLFKTADACKDYVESNADRKRKNLIRRRMRFVRKALNQEFNYFVTLTYDNKKHTEDSFKKAVKLQLKNFSFRKSWRYMGVWERGKKTNRLHFHGLFYIPEGTLSGEFVITKDYNFKKHVMRTVKQSTFFLDRFGRNEMEELDNGPLFGYALAYILKYLEKTGERITCSKGLFMYFYTDVQGNEVVCKLSNDEHDNKLVLSDKFTCWDEGCKVGTVSPQTIAELRKAN
ncbi:MAG: hypothetical protein NC114_08965 [Ruminococcus flavefaciens]|nr:hypothetical protein [Ruminococcus flavefaciens]